MRLRFVLLAVLAAAFAAMPVAAHHSHNNYAIADFTQLNGVVKEVHLINPHSWVYLEVKDQKGEAVLWALEATGPNGLKNNGIKPEDVKIGDAARVRCHGLRDGSAGCLLGFLTPMHGDAARGHGVEKEWD